MADHDVATRESSKIIACHEAGHAVALFVLGLSISKVSIKVGDSHVATYGPDPEKFSEEVHDLTLSELEEAENHIVAAVAGGLAEAFAFNRKTEPGEDTQFPVRVSADVAEAMELVGPIAAEYGDGSEETERFYFEVLVAKARALLFENKVTIMRLVEELLARESLRVGEIREVLTEEK